MKTLRFYFLLILLLSAGYLSAQTVDSVSVFSDKMQTEVKNLVILPKGYDNSKQYPVVYLLHGYGGNAKNWIGIKPSLPQDASDLQLIIVCPDGRNSWYWDSPVNPKMQYETYVSKELVDFIDKKYSTVKSPKGRAITGLSMGGHGGLWLGIRHQDVFGACGSMSGGVDIRPFPNNWEMKKSIGTYKENTSVWEEHTVINQINKIEPNSLEIIIDCGIDDFFFEVNQKLHEKLLYNNILHDYIVRPGRHDGKYWNNAIDYQLLFFYKFFSKNR